MDKKRFDELCEAWQAGTAVLSGGHERHPAFLELSQGGNAILPWVFNRIMFDDRAHWSLLAWKVSGEVPFPKSARGCVPVMNAYWIVWGVNNGYINDATISRDGCKTFFDLREKPGPKPKKKD